MYKYLTIILLSLFLSDIIPAKNINNGFNEKLQIEKARSERVHSSLEAVNFTAAVISNSDVPDSVIKNILSEINQDSIKKYIKSLQDFGERYYNSFNAGRAAQWIRDRYTAMGYSEVSIDSFYLPNQPPFAKNVTAMLPGKKTNEYIIIGAHYDSRGSGSLAPGADDNASGVSASIEIARVLKKRNYLPECSILFVSFGAEEPGLLGSIDYAQNCQNKGMNIKLMINADMISYSTRSLDSSKVNINYYSGAESWLSKANETVLKYTKLSPVTGDRNASNSDSRSFYDFGYQAIYFEENDFHRFYHSIADTIGNYNMAYCAEVIKAVCALAIQASVVPPPVPRLTLNNVGDGQSFKAVWKAVNSPDFHQYKVYMGRAESSYDTSFTTSDTSMTIKVVNISKIYFAVSVLTLQQEESSLLQKTVIINAVPPVPMVSIQDIDKTRLSLNLSLSEKALMFSGYNIFRSDSVNGTYVKLNNSPVAGTEYSDLSMEPGRYYFYKVKTIYNNGAESQFSSVIRGRLVSLDKGIGLIITTSQSAGGGEVSPLTQQIAEYYDRVLKDFKFSREEKFIGNGFAGLSELGAYSTIIWCNNSTSSYGAPRYSQDWIKKYLEMGGRMLMVTFNPTEEFNKSYLHTDSSSFKPGDFLYDYFKIGMKKYRYSRQDLFSGALSRLSGYPDLNVDSAKAPSTLQFQLSRVEAIFPNTSGNAILGYSSYSTSNSMNGLPVGVEYMGNDFKTILLSFPLYYLKEVEVKEFLKYVLKNKFEETTDVHRPSELTQADYALNQNFPNPFNPVTTISYSIPKNSNVQLKIFDILGRELKTLVNKMQSAGQYKIQFDASSLSSGIYIYTIQAGNYRASRKLVVLK